MTTTVAMIGCAALLLAGAGEDQEDAVTASLARVPERAAAWTALLEASAGVQRADLEALVVMMPRRDLERLEPDFVAEDARLAREAWRAAPWAGRLDDAVGTELFRRHVLPYAHVSETREPWRAELRALCLPVVAEARTPGEAALALNAAFLDLFGVRYSTTRERADQSPSESMRQGVASCTGLSILLADACRSVGVPARLAGIADWPAKNGNHTWVEVWDGGWHFLGAAEPDGRGLDHAWFTADAAGAIPGHRLHGIHAVEWGAPESFPMVWAKGWEVGGVEVTRRYLPAQEAGGPSARLALEARADGERVATAVRLADAAAPDGTRAGETRGPGADTNDLFAFEVQPGVDYRLEVRRLDGSWSAPFLVAVPAGAELVRVSLDLAGLPGAEGRDVCVPIELVAPVEVVGDLAAADAVVAAESAAVEWFTAALTEGEAAAGDFPEAAFEGLRGAALRRVLRDAWRGGSLWTDARADIEAHRVRAGGQEAPYVVREVGTRPAGGWPLVIAMHGGGGVPKEVNDSQWEHMKIYYRDHPGVGGTSGYLYLALRAPNDAWNGFYDDRISTLVAALVRQFVLFGDVDPDRVHALGYSHGGYGAFVIGPKAPWRFASVHASAAAPSPGETALENLRSLPFSFMVGGRDTAYGRRERCEQAGAALAALRAAATEAGHPGDYPFTFDLIEGNGHGGLPDRDLLPRLLAHTREPLPERITWRMTDAVLQDFAWLHVPAPQDGALVQVARSGNRVEVRAEGLGEGATVVLRLDERLVDLARPLTLVTAAGEREVTLRPTAAAAARALLATGDPQLALTCEVEVAL